jgi:hypothetical protein
VPSSRDRRGRATRDRTGGSGARKPRPGLPDPASVVAVETFTSPKGSRYRILKTNETDPYDPPPASTKGPTKKRP